MPAWALVGIGLCYLVVFLVYALIVVRWPLPMDQGEGFVLHDARRAAAGLPLYTSNEDYPFYSSNYPPGFPLLLARLARWTGLDLAVGRATSVAAALVAAGAIAWLVRAGGGTGLAAAIAALLFTASPYVYGLAPLFKSDLPALALSLLALAILTAPAGRWLGSRDGREGLPDPGDDGPACGRPSAGRLALTLPLLLAALWTKPLTGAAAGAVLLWTILRRPRLGIAAALLWVLACAAVQWWLDRRSGGYFSLNFVSGNFSEWRWGNLPDLYGRFLLVNAPLMLVALLWVRRSWRAPARWLPLFYFAGCLGVAFGVGIWGAGSSYLLHLLAAATILAGLALSRLPAGAGRGTAALLLLLQFGLWFHLPGLALPFNDLRHPTAGRLPDAADLHAADEIVAWLAESGGPVYSEDGFFALAAGLDLVGNPTTLVELESAGRWRGEALIGMFERREFRAVVLGPHMLPERVLDAIRRNYATIDAQTVYRVRYLIARPKVAGDG